MFSITFTLFLIVILGILNFIFEVKKTFDERSSIKTNKSKYIDEKVEIIIKLSNKKYRVKIFGEEWTGVSSEILEIGEMVKVKSIIGNKFILEKL